MIAVLSCKGILASHHVKLVHFMVIVRMILMLTIEVIVMVRTWMMTMNIVTPLFFLHEPGGGMHMWFQKETIISA